MEKLLQFHWLRIVDSLTKAENMQLLPKTIVKFGGQDKAQVLIIATFNTV